jgi:hypothetical protein
LGVPQVYGVPYITRDIDELKNVIKEEITAIPDVAREAKRTVCNRLEQCTRDDRTSERHALQEVK